MEPRGPMTSQNTTAVKEWALCAIIAATVLSGACLLGSPKGIGHDQDAHQAPRATQDAGRDAYLIQINSIQQSLWAGLASTVMGLAAYLKAGWRARTVQKDEDTLLRAIEHAEEPIPKEKRPVKRYMEQAVRNPRINRRVERLTKRAAR